MALVVKDRVLETSNTNGTGTFTLAGAVNGFQAFSVIGVGNTTYYAITEETNNQWEVGLGTVGSGTLTRDTVLSSSNGGSKVDFADGLKQVFCDYPANKAVYLDASGNVSSLGTITSGVWNGSTIPVANGGTGVTTSSGANSVVLRDASSNITANALDDGYINTVASGTPIVLTVSSVRRYTITGSGGQTIKLPDATTLANGTVFQFDNNQSSGAITVNNNSNTLVVSVPSGGFVLVNLLSNAIAAGSWDRHDQAPSNVSWSTNTFDYAGSITSATWNGNVVQVNRGGTGASTLTGYVKGSGTSALTASSTIPNTDISGLGTMSTQNANAVAITGGTIDNTVIGGTTPAAGTFTNVIDQQLYLAGGNNYITYSNTFNNAVWVYNAASATINTVTSPTGATNASTITENTSNAFRNMYFNGTTVSGGGNVTYSIYVKPNNRNYVEIDVWDGNVNAVGVYFNISTGAYIASNIAGSAFSLSSYAITSAGNGWYRLSVTVNRGTTTYLFPRLQFNSSYPFASYVGDGTSGIYTYGAQIEDGNIASIYTPTTSATVTTQNGIYLNGGQILVDTTGAMVVQPAGTGALQAQATTSSTVGGNARGANAVDWQTARAAAAQVASGQYSSISGGYGNTASQPYSSVVNGQYNTTSNYFSGVLNGSLNTASGLYSGIVGGQSNTASGYYGLVNGGYTNSTTSNSAVTTQSGTMNATTAVTLSGSNASIKVGQYITGTSIAGDTYVAAISGTSLTLSKVASGSSTSTLSFYTPHGVVVGGGNNQATGSYSFIGGGGDAGTAANRNVASGAWSAVVGGLKNTASGLASFVAGGGTYDGANGGGNTASGIASFVANGWANNASGNASCAIGVGMNTNGDYSTGFGYYGTTRAINGYITFAANIAPIAANSNQAGLLVLGKQTTNATATVLTSDSNAASGTNQVILPNNSAYYFKGAVIAGVTGAGDTKGWSIEGVIKRGAGVGTTALVGTPTVTSMYADLGAATWAVTATADTTNGGLKITVTGQASTTIRWVCELDTTEMTY
jgi:hypothetical protein